MSTNLPTGVEKTKLVRSMFDTIAPRYQMVNRIMTLGMDHRWRRRAIRDLRLPAGSVVLDVAAGTGDFTRELARQGFTAVAADLSYGMLHAGENLPHKVQCDATTLPFASAIFQGLTCGYALRNFTDLAAVLNEMGRIVAPGGRISLLEVAEPRSGIWRAGFRIWFRHVVPFVGSLLSDRAAYRYLPRSTAYLPSAGELTRLLGEAGFVAVNHRLVMGGLSQQFLATRSR
jgi:demethylmenaquinone methyltransferase/2-methoxy-6-polyprenyl-1,4-benzoquinol methylase